MGMYVCMHIYMYVCVYVVLGVCIFICEFMSDVVYI